MSTENELAAILVLDEGARPDHSVFLASRVMDNLQWPMAGGPALVINPRNGQVRPGVTTEDLLAEMRGRFPFAFGGGPIEPPPQAAPVPTYGPDTLTGRALAERAAKEAGQVIQVNPYHPATRNLTQQVLMEKNDPAKAAQLKAQAA